MADEAKCVRPIQHGCVREDGDISTPTVVITLSISVAMARGIVGRNAVMQAQFIDQVRAELVAPSAGGERVR